MTSSQHLRQLTVLLIYLIAFLIAWETFSHISLKAEAASIVSYGFATGIASLCLGIMTSRRVANKEMFLTSTLFILGSIFPILVRDKAWPIAIASSCLIGLGHMLGSQIGVRVLHPGHLLAACFVASAADLSSVIHPAGPTHQIVSDDTALSLATIAFPVPGVNAIAPTLGVGDLIFMAFILGASHAHQLRRTRLVIALWIALQCAVGISYWLAQNPQWLIWLKLPQPAVPAIPLLSIAALLTEKQFRNVRSEDKRLTQFATGASVIFFVAAFLSR